MEEFAVWALESQPARRLFGRRYEKMRFDQRENDGSGLSPERRLGHVQAVDVAGAKLRLKLEDTMSACYKN